MTTRHHYTGLTDAEVEASRKKWGANTLTPPPKTSLWKRFFEKLTGPLGHHIPGWEDGDALIFILEIAALLSIFISCAEYFGWFGLSTTMGMAVFFEPLGILIAILLATGISFIFELKADHEFSILNQVNDEEPVQVIRNGNPEEIARRDVVVGDIVIIETGEEIPADAELLEAVSLHMDESSLTGEPICSKTTHPEAMKPNATYPSNHVMRGTKVMEGHGICRVFAVGDQTENGKVFQAVQIDDSVRTPLNQQLDGLGMLITRISYCIAALVVVGRLIVFGINCHWAPDALWSVELLTHLLETVLIAVTLIVVAVPEGLPMAVALSLAYSMRRMLKANNLVRKMHACETMGATTVICTDKTGTLTQNQMQVYEAYFFGMEGQQLTGHPQGRLIAEGIAMNSTAVLDRQHADHIRAIGNPTEGALLLWLDHQGIDYQQIRDDSERIDEIPFSTERKYMATLVRNASGQRVLYVKGAPEIVESLCSQYLGNASHSDVNQQLAHYQEMAMRTLAFAYAELADDEQGIHNGQLAADHLTLMGIVAISDPVRSDVPPAIKECTDAGIDIIIVTGDTPATARQIGREIGLWHDSDQEESIITGQEVARMSDEALAARAQQLKIVARARPMDKKRLVEALQSKGEVVAVTGDGTNDAPALKTAQVGLSMGDGSSVAKEASDITIIDNSFASISRAVMWGRSLYRNIQRFLLFQMTVNVAACLIVLVGAFVGTESPLSVTQMLWVNLIMDTFAAMALASLPPSHQVMRESPRRRDAFIISHPMRGSIIITGVLFFLILLYVLFAMQYNDIRCVEDLFNFRFGTFDGLSPYELSLFFTLFVMLQFWNLFNARAFATHRSAFHFRNCQSFLAIAAIIFFGQILIVNFGGAVFNVVPLRLGDWLWILGLTALVLIVGEAVRWFKGRL